MKISRKNRNNRRLIKKYGLNSTILAKMFGYSNSASLRNSTRYQTFLNGIEELLKIVESSQDSQVPQDSQ